VEPVATFRTLLSAVDVFMPFAGRLGSSRPSSGPPIIPRAPRENPPTKRTRADRACPSLASLTYADLS